MTRPSTPLWISRKLDQIRSSSSWKATTPTIGPNKVPAPPSSTMTGTLIVIRMLNMSVGSM